MINNLRNTVVVMLAIVALHSVIAGVVSHSAAEIDAGSPDFNSVTADDLNATQLAANRFTTSGTVGIGTSTPNSAYALDISNSTTASVRILKTGAAGTPQLVIYNAGALVGALGNLGFGNPTDLTLYPNPASNVLIDPVGGASKVGVGTSSPDSKLHVVGAVCAEAADSGTCTPAAGDVRGTRLCIAGDCRNVWPAAGASLTEADVETYIVNDIGTGYVPRDNGVRFENSPIYTTASNGNVGIGEPNPTVKLQVNGNIKATAIDVEGWTAFTPPAGWSCSYPCAYMKDPMGFVHLKGQAIWVSGGGLQIFVGLPVGYRPAARSYYMTSYTTLPQWPWTKLMSNTLVDIDGTIWAGTFGTAMYGLDATVNLDGITFKAA
jgi:hypothetical protein